MAKIIECDSCKANTKDLSNINFYQIKIDSRDLDICVDCFESKTFKEVYEK